MEEDLKTVRGTVFPTTLSVKRRRGRKRARGTRTPMPQAAHPHARWSLDFLADSFGASRKFRILAVIDDCCRENLCLIADTSISGARVARELDALVRIYAKPACIVSDRRGSGNDPGDRFPEEGDRVHQSSHPEVGRPERRPLALHRPRQATAERLHRELQRQAQGRMSAVLGANAPNCRLDRGHDVCSNVGMSEPLVIQTLTQKRAEMLGRIRAHEAQIAQARHDLAHVNATIELFAAPERQRVRYMVSHGFFKKGEIADICGHLDVDGEMTTRELAERVMAERDLEISDTALRNSVVFKVVQALRHAKRRKLVRMVEKRKGMCLWAAGDAVTLRVVASIPSTPG